MSSAAGVGKAVPGQARTRGSATSITGSRLPSSRPRRPAVAIAATGAASSTMNSTLGPGRAGSRGR
ncbi:hypothetical protein LAUMK7_01702 [Mycobacterium kansasii]|nr:hypothetical protein LAUMK22_01074 [Mycobacterium kansasii]VAZ65596.1 hypothetical protein LAUMK40_01723 [Mycobacterium kansasii]VAZ73105.1 hypothetical protein LAUMK7_01702 [Mycobacterium kansasii]